MTEKSRLEEIKARVEAATPGNNGWSLYRDPAKVDQVLIVGENMSIIAKVSHAFEDAEFIAHAREDVPYLLTEVDQLRARLKDAESYLKNIASPGRGYVEPRLPMEVELARAYFAKHGGGSESA